MDGKLLNMVKLRTIIADATNTTYRAYYQMKASSELPIDVNDVAVYAISKMVYIFKRYPNVGLIAAIDGCRPYWREKIIRPQEYKAHRDYDTHDVDMCVESVSIVTDILPQIGVPVLGDDHVEADDVVACIASLLGFDRCVVYGNDRDFWQLASLGSTVLNDMLTITPRTKEPIRGVPLNGFLMYRAMCGDSSDNLKGVYGVGPATGLTVMKALCDAGTFIEPVTNPYKAVKSLKALLDDPAVEKLKPSRGISAFTNDVDAAMKALVMNMRAMKLPHPMCPFDTRSALDTCISVSGTDTNKRVLHRLMSTCQESALLRNLFQSVPRRQHKCNSFLKTISRNIGGGRLRSLKNGSKS